MVAPRFYIFGVPDGFDMLEGTRQEISYFQRFYDGSTEDTKFTSHRDSNGNVTYTFLKYNLSSGKSRTGSFFGMSLAFSGVYCNHPLRLYELFDYVYQNHVLCNTSDASKGILKSIANSDIKAQYLITRFEDRKEHIKFVEKVFQHNLATDDMLTSSFYPLDPGFKNENQNLVVKLPLVVEFEDDKQREIYRGRFEESLIGRFREYSYVTISPDWKPKVIDNTKEPDSDVEIAPQKIVQWKDLIPDYQRYIIQGLGNLATTVLDEVKRYQKQTEEILGQLKKYSYNKNIAPSIQANYEELCNQLADLYQKAADTQSGGGEGTNPPPDPNSPNPTPTPSFWNNVKEWISDNKGKIAGIVGATVVLVVLLVLLRPKNDSGTPPSQTSYCCAEEADSLIRDALSIPDFIKANEIADTISDKDFRSEKLAMIVERLSIYNTNLGKEIDKLIDDKKWKDAFVKTEKYFDEEAKNTKIDEIRIACENDFTTRIDEVNESNYSSKSPGLEQELLAVKGYIGNENYKALKEKLDKKNKPKEEPKLDTYVVEFYKTDNVYSTESDTPTITFTSTRNTSTKTINVGEDHYIYKIKKNGKYLKGTDLDSAIKNRSHKDICNPKSNEIRLWLQTIDQGTFEVGNMKIIVTK